MRYINLDKQLSPYSFEIELSDNIFRMELYYNSDYDYFTMDLYLEDEPLVFGEKLVLGNSMFDIISYLELLDEKLVVDDIAKKESRVTYDNLNEQVFLYVRDKDEE